MIEEGVVSLLRSEGPASWGNQCIASLGSCSLQRHGDSSVFLRKSSSFDCFHKSLNKVQCLSLENEVDHYVFVLTQFKNKSFSLL